LVPAVVIKPPIALLFVVLLWLRQFKLLALGVMGTAALVFVPFAILGRQSFDDWLAAGQYWSSARYLVSPSIVGVYGALLRHLTDNPYVVAVADSPFLAQAIYWLIVALAGGVLVWALRSLDNESSGNRLLVYAITVVLTLLISPVTELGHLVLLAIPLAVAWHFTAGITDWLTHAVAVGLLALIYPPLIVLYLFLYAMLNVDFRRPATFEPLLIFVLLLINALLFAGGVPRADIDFNQDLHIGGLRALVVEINLFVIAWVAALVACAEFRARGRSARRPPPAQLPAQPVDTLR
jgi:hypothetical protein